MKFEKISKKQWYADNQSTDNPYISDENYNDIKLPKRATKYSAGYDFYAPYNISIPPHKSVIIPTGIRWATYGDHYTVLMLYPRSGLGFKHGIRLMNTTGVIDADYYQSDNEGHIMLKLYNPSDNEVSIPKGKGMVQGIIMPYYVVDDDVVDEERNGGFGSTDK